MGVVPTSRCAFDSNSGFAEGSILGALGRRLTMDQSRTWGSIDLGGPGKAGGHVAVPISSDDSAYGVVSIPITRIAGRPGPSVLLTAGVHGDEFEGPIVLRRLAASLEASEVSGRLLIVPALNPPA